MESYLLPPLGYSTVRWRIVDKSQTVSPLSAVVAGGVAYMHNGPVGDLYDISDELLLKAYYGEPKDDNFNDWFNISRVFNYKSSGINGTVKISRAVGDGSLNSAIAITSTGLVNDTDLTTQRIDNKDQALDATIIFDTNTTLNGGDDTEARLKFFSKYPTDEVYKIAIATSTDFATADVYSGVSFLDNFNDAPVGTQIAVAVLDASGQILEKRIVDLVPGNKDDEGVDTFIENVFQTKSPYVLCYLNDSVTDEPASIEATELTKGAVVAPITADYLEALSYFEDMDVDINYMIGHHEVMSEIMTLCEGRQDCSFKFGAKTSDVVGVGETTAVSNLLTYVNDTLNRNSTYGQFYGNAALIYDEYNNKQRWITLHGDIVGLIIQNNLQDNPWQAIAGMNRGQIKDIIKLAFNPKPNSMRTLQLNKINPVISKHGAGNLIWGYNNYTSIKSTLQDGNATELLIYVWRAIKPFAETKLFELLDDITWNSVESVLNQFFAQIKAARGVYDYRITTDRSDFAVDQNILSINIGVTISKFAREVQIAAVVAKTGTDLTTVV